MSIVIEDVTNLFGFELKLRFDPAQVEVVDADSDTSGVQIAHGDFLSPDWELQNAVDNQEGTVAYAVCQMNPSQPQSGSGVLATVTWRAKEPGTSAIHLYDVILAGPLGAEIPADVEDGEIVVGEAQPVPGGTATPSPTSTRKPVASSPSATPSVVPASNTALPTPTEQPEKTTEAAETPSATETPPKSGTGTPTPGRVTQEATANDDTRPTTPAAKSESGPTLAPTEEPARIEGDTPAATAASTNTPSTAQASAPGATPVRLETTSQDQASRPGPGGLSSYALLAVAGGCLIFGINALIVASILWRRK